MSKHLTSNERFVQIEPIDMVDFRAYVNAHGMYLEFFISGELVRFDMHGAKRWVEWAQRAIGASTEPPAVDVAPIAKLTVRDGLVQRAGLYAPGLPDGDHDVFPVPLSPKGELRPHVLAEPPNVWQPIETAPKLGKWVLLWWPAITDAAFVGYCVDGVWKAATSGDKWPGIDGPTHWMPLPAGPAVTKEESQ